MKTNNHERKLCTPIIDIWSRLCTSFPQTHYIVKLYISLLWLVPTTNWFRHDCPQFDFCPLVFCACIIWGSKKCNSWWICWLQIWFINFNRTVKKCRKKWNIFYFWICFAELIYSSTYTSMWLWKILYSWTTCLISSL